MPRWRLSEAGRQIWAAMQPQIDEFYRVSLAGFSNADIIDTMHYLEALRRNFIALQNEQGEAAEE